MSTYIMLFNYTDQGLRNIRKSPDRLDAFRQPKYVRALSRRRSSASRCSHGQVRRRRH